jgi:hypothetical protein
MTAAVAMSMALLSADPARAAVAQDCTTGYLLCLNDASQETGWLWRTAREAECGIGYYGCLRAKASGG